MSGDKDKIDFARKMERFKHERNAWTATGIVFIVLFAFAAGAAGYLALYLHNLCNGIEDYTLRIAKCPKIIGSFPRN